MYDHNEEPADDSSNESMMLSPTTHGRFHGGAFAWFRQEPRSILLLGNCGLLKSLEAMGIAPGIGLRGPIDELVCIHKNRSLLRSTHVTKCVWTFPSVGCNSTDDENEKLIRGFFMSAAAYSKIRTMARSSSESVLKVQCFGHRKSGRVLF